MIKDQRQVVHLRALTAFPQNFLLAYSFLGFAFTLFFFCLSMSNS